MHLAKSIFGLLKQLKDQAKALVREEIELVKAEMSEKAATFARNSASIAIGGFVAYAGLIVLLGGLGILIAYFFQNTGINPLLATFIGLGIIGLVVIGGGVVFIMKGISALKKASLKPEKTIETLKELKEDAGGEVSSRPVKATNPPKEKKEDAPSSEEVEARVMRTEDRMMETAEELGDKLSIQHLWRTASTDLKRHPTRWGVLAAGCGMAGGYLLSRKRKGNGGQSGRKWRL